VGFICRGRVLSCGVKFLLLSKDQSEGIARPYSGVGAAIKRSRICLCHFAKWHFETVVHAPMRLLVSPTMASQMTAVRLADSRSSPRKQRYLKHVQAP